MERIHPNRMPGGLDRRRAPGGLEHAELRLQLSRMPAEGIEGIANPVRIETVSLAGDVVEAR
jgi:hypothetical protein